MAVVVIDEHLAEVLRRFPENKMQVRCFLHDRPVFGCSFYGRWTVSLYASRGERTQRCVHNAELGESCPACWVLDRSGLGENLVMLASYGRA